MDGVELLPVEIAEALKRGATVVTGNQRAARTLRRGWDLRNRKLGLASWAPAPVMTWDAWVAGLWRGLVLEGHASQMLLNRTQEHAVWRSILEADQELASLRSVDSLAEMAAEAWRLVSSYEGRTQLRGAIGGTDTRAFQRWALAFERRCRADGFLAQAQLEETLIAALEKEVLKPPPYDVMLVGFDRMTPAQVTLVEALRSFGVVVVEMQPAVAHDRRMLVEAMDEQEELSAAARWVRRFSEEKPEARIAVIVPGLEKQRNEIDRVFREVLAPELEDIRAGDDTGPYEFSLGVSLAQVPMVADALDLLRWASDSLPLERVSGLLLSPYFAMSNEERGARAEFDAFELRRSRMLRPEMSIDGLVAVAERWKRREKISRLVGVLRVMRVAANRLQGMNARTNAEWAERIREYLEAAGWGASGRVRSMSWPRWTSTACRLSLCRRWRRWNGLRDRRRSRRSRMMPRCK
jgi:ATP-dependent helicase/nuclease subunit B